MMAQITQDAFEQMLSDKFEEGRRSRDDEVAMLKHYRPIQSMVVVSRRWHEPQIRVQFMQDELRVDMSARDFAKSVAMACASSNPMYPKWWKRLLMKSKDWELMFELHRESMTQEVFHALDDVVGEMKQATIHSPPPLMVVKK